MPAPRKLNAASAMITTPMLSVVRTMKVLSTLGRMCVSMMRGSEQPRTLARATKSRFFRARTSPRMMRAKLAQRSRLMAMYQRPEALPHRHRQQQREQYGGKGEGRIDEAHQDAFDDAAHVAGDDADRGGRRRRRPSKPEPQRSG